MEIENTYWDRNLKFSKSNNLRTFSREFEVFCLGLLNNLLKSEGKSELRKFPEIKISGEEDSIRVNQFDALSHDGISNLQGITLIEIKAVFNPKVITKFLSQLKYLGNEFNSCLIIFGSELNDIDRDYINRKIKLRKLKMVVEVWDYNNIVALSKKYNEVSSKLIKNIGNEIFNSTIEQAKKSEDNWKDDRERQLNSLKSAYQKDEIVLMIGAGTSKDAGVPNWNELLKELNLSIINQNISTKLTNSEKNEFAEELVNMQNGAPLVSASYIRNALGEEFVNEIRKSLYRNVKPIKEQLLLETIAKLSIPRRRQVGIEAVITYNFDDLLENHLKRNGVEYKSIYTEGDFEIPTKLSVYHVHGFIPKSISDYKNLDDSILVFSEDGYHQMQTDPYSWSNIVQMKALREKTCVLIGLSGVDPNLRRLFSIHSEKFSGCKHYIILERQFKSSLSSKSQKFQEFSKLHHKIQEDTFKEIGLNVIWYEEHPEVPKILEQLKN